MVDMRAYSADIGKNFFAYLITKQLLKPDSHILDIGCGAGLLSVPILNHLDSSGYYEGMDIIQESVAWCQKNISSKHNNAKFIHQNIFNASYNPRGIDYGGSYHFPYPDATYDVVIMKSVATHLRPEELINYLNEIARILKIGGKLIVTYFVLDDDTITLVDQGRTTYNFKYQYQDCLVTNPSMPEDAIAYRIERLKQYYQNAGLVIDSISYGGWSSRPNPDQSTTGQDLVIAYKA